MHKLRTVRIHYLYIFIGSALLSAAFLFAVERAVALLYSHYSGKSGVFLFVLSIGPLIILEQSLAS